MRQIISSPLSLLMGRLGSWPTDVSRQAAEAIVRLGSQCPEKAVFVDVGAGPGYSTVLLAHCAHGLNGKVLTVDNADIDSQAALWFRRALTLFRIEKLVSVVGEVKDRADFIVVRQQAGEELLKKVLADGLKPGGIIVVLGGTESTFSWAHLEAGYGYAVWKNFSEAGSNVVPLADGETANLQAQGSPAPEKDGNLGPLEFSPDAKITRRADQEPHEEVPEQAAGEGAPENGAGEQKNQPKKRQKVVGAMNPERI